MYIKYVENYLEVSLSTLFHRHVRQQDYVIYLFINSVFLVVYLQDGE